MVVLGFELAKHIGTQFTNLEIEERCDTFLIMMRESAMNSQIRFSQMYQKNPLKKTVCCDTVFDHFEEDRLVSFKLFRNNGNLEHFEAYQLAEQHYVKQ
jgi:hypothetical protein